MDTTQAKLSPRPFYAMAKPAGASCNLRCAYCYYAEKAALHEAAAPAAMDDGLLETFVRQYIEAQPAPDVLFTWHGGEPLLRPLSFYRRAVGLQRRYAGGRRVDNCIQTNGTLLDDEWCRFFRDEGFLVGISIDGPRRLHDPLRQGSFDRVMRGVELLARHGDAVHVTGLGHVGLRQRGVVLRRVPRAHVVHGVGDGVDFVQDEGLDFVQEMLDVCER